jgi:ubiquinone/menaquinone biosynthesis C-methylase UbiE
MAEADFYENPVTWDLERYLGDEGERKRFQATADAIVEHSERLLDVGTGNGAFLSFLEHLSSPLHLRGLERSKAAIAAADCQAEIVEGSIDALPFTDRSFDTVTALEVIEHLPRGVYSKALSEMARVADSQVLISVPYKERRLMVVCPECGCRFSPIYHLRTFDERTLQDLVPGFELDRTELVTTEVHWLLTGLATRIRRLRDRLEGRIPVRTTCPQCAAVVGSLGTRSAARPTDPGARRRSLRSTVLSWMPKAQHPHWIIASYRRIPA